MIYPFSGWAGLAPALIAWVVVAIIWDAVWKGIGLWRSGRNKQPVWFVFIFLLNTLGILPIIYLAFCQKDKARERSKAKKPF